MDADLIVVGGGVIGTAIAWRAAQAGRSVTLIDPDTDDKASLVAAGMLGPVSESVFGEQDLLALNLHAIDGFPAFAAELERATGLRTGLRTEGTLAVAHDNDDLAALDRLTAFRHSIGLAAQRLDARECRRLEPFLAPATRGGVLATGDLSVDNRRYLAALRAGAASLGVRSITGYATQVTLVTQVQVRVSPVAPNAPVAPGTPSTSEVLSARHVVIAAGHGTSHIKGIPDQIRTAIRPVKGQILRLRHPASLPHLLTRTIRATVAGRDVYLVPRADGEIVVGATQEERDDREVTAGAVHDLLRDAMTAVPALSELILAEASAGLRPGSGDNGPILGWLGSPDPSGTWRASHDAADAADAADAGVIVAAGHFRNGVLLSAATAGAVLALLAGEEPHPAWAPFRPGRLR